jgi:effector-binding domain-containing protein
MTVNAADDGSVSLQTSAPRALAAVRARVPAGRVGAVFADYLNQVYAASREAAVPLDGQNIFVYRNVEGRNDEIDVEFGVGVKAPFTPVGRVTYSLLPIGEVATTTHWGDYAGLGDAHHAVLDWCRTHNRTPTGTRWEIYGHWTNDPTRLRTDVYYLLEPAER